MMRRIALATCAALCAASAAHAQTWSLGPNFGLTFLTPRGGGGTVTTLALPASVAVGGLQPGLRVGHLLPGGISEVYVDGGLLLASGSGVHSNALFLTGNYQFNVMPTSDLTPYGTAGLGLIYQSLRGGGTDASAASLTFGAGLGLRKRVAGEAGTVRTEIRIDHYTQAEDRDVVVIPGGNAVSVKVGFDLWFK